ncbi:MAG: hypothetical protein H7A37_00795 [Chlamydiales bacterium]|nr:hypothetical protein [Chlamydiia bacterium]MCP5506830.1 hypothetical protein [Chlamydiales bacterium]
MQTTIIGQYDVTTTECCYHIIFSQFNSTKKITAEIANQKISEKQILFMENLAWECFIAFGKFSTPYGKPLSTIDNNRKLKIVQEACQGKRNITINFDDNDKPTLIISIPQKQ